MKKIEDIIETARAEGRDINAAVADYLHQVHRNVTTIMQKAEAMPLRAGVAIESALDGIWRAAEDIISHHVMLDNSGPRDVADKK